MSVVSDGKSLRSSLSLLANGSIGAKRPSLAEKTSAADMDSLGGGFNELNATLFIVIPDLPFA